jgi:hypothetical protein
MPDLRPCPVKIEEPCLSSSIASAKADGRWDKAYPGPASAQLPSDLMAAIAANPKSQATFDTSQNRYGSYYRVNEAKRADTRARRIANFVEMLAWGETVHPQGSR